MQAMEAEIQPRMKNKSGVVIKLVLSVETRSSAAQLFRVRWSILCTPGMGVDLWGVVHMGSGLELLVSFILVHNLADRSI